MFWHIKAQNWQIFTSHRSRLVYLFGCRKFYSQLLIFSDSQIHWTLASYLYHYTVDWNHKGGTTKLRHLTAKYHSQDLPLIITCPHEVEQLGFTTSIQSYITSTISTILDWAPLAIVQTPEFMKFQASHFAVEINFLKHQP